MQPDDESDLLALVELEQREMLQQLLAMLSSTVVTSPQESVCSCQGTQPASPPKKRWVKDPVGPKGGSVAATCSQYRARILLPKPH